MKYYVAHTDDAANKHVGTWGTSSWVRNDPIYGWYHLTSENHVKKRPPEEATASPAAQLLV